MQTTAAEVMVFVDAGYLFGVMKSYHELASVDDLAVASQRLVDLIRSRVEAQVGPVLRMRWYDATDPTGRITNQRALAIAPLEGVRLVEGRIVRRSGELEQKAVDTRLVADMVTIAFQRQVPRFVVITGDEDMAPGVEAAQDAGIRVEVWSVGGTDQPSTVSRVLVALADRHQVLAVDELAATITVRPRASVIPRELIPAPADADAAPTGGPVPTPTTGAPASASPAGAPAPRPPVPQPPPRPRVAADPASRPTAPAEPSPVDLSGLYEIDQAAYHRAVGSDAATTEQQRATRTGAEYAARWWSAADDTAKDHVGRLCPGPNRFAPIPAAIDADLLRFAEDHGLDTWGSPWIKVGVRNGFWDEIDTVAPTDGEHGRAAAGPSAS